MKKVTLALILVLTAAFAINAAAGEIRNQYGLEFRGGLALYMSMDDPDNWAKQYSSVLDEEMDFAPDFGISVLYKHRNDFVWNIGYNHLFTARNTFTTTAGAEYEESVSADEIFFVPSYIFLPNNFVSLSLGLGPSVILASMDRTGPANLGSLSAFYGAYGRNIGFLALANLEVTVNSKVALKIGGGYRGAFVDDIEFIENIDGVESRRQVVWTIGSRETTRPYELNFSGLFGEVGLRWYFKPMKTW